ncbi:lecithin retinol acyltransferase family protein [Photobacterium nomapromontoriensis]|uniref:lecithin retinol acyltransferase family protein n=1 Tax=Photobacterium nomapromontoriensis TaxID=2910237 RepID=UPI003D0F7111
MHEKVLPAGTVLKIRCSTYWHYGISDGQGYVVHNSKKWRKVARETEDEFAEGHVIVESSIRGEDPAIAVSFALRQLGRPYDLFSQNCEQFVREAHGLPVECTQFQRLVVVAAGGYISMSATTPLIKMAGLGLLIGAAISSSERSPYKSAVNGAKLAVGSTLLVISLLRRFF